MPYGVDKKLGGDSKENVSWMERCVSGVQDKNPKMAKSNAIAICKAQLRKNKTKKSELEFNYNEETIVIDQDVLDRFNSYKEFAIKNIMKDNRNFNDANYLFEALLANNNYDF